MRKRVIGPAEVVTAGLAIAFLFPVTLPAQEGGGEKHQPGPVRRMPSGKPDLTGYWFARGRVGMYSVEKTEERKKLAIPAGPGLIIDRRRLGVLLHCLAFREARLALAISGDQVFHDMQARESVIGIKDGIRVFAP